MVVNINRQLAGLEDLLFGTGTTQQNRQGELVEVTMINAANMPFDEFRTVEEALAFFTSVTVELGEPGTQPVFDAETNTLTMPGGLSAYQVAVNNGFMGTEVQWLLSLEGTDGVDGIDGTGIESVVLTNTIGNIKTYTITFTNTTTTTFDVTDGINGANGTNGIDGIDGQDIDHVARTLGDGSAGTTDTYTIYGDIAETISLGTFTVYNGIDGLGSGDMLKSTYDTTNNGKVDVAEAAESVPWDGVSGKPTLAMVATSGSYTDLSDKPTIPTDYSLPTASAAVLGGVKVGNNLTITDGILSADAQSITVDSIPTDSSTNAVSSNGVFNALAGKVDDGQVLTDVPLGALFTDTVYTHPTTDGSLHVPATGITNAGKVLTAGATAGSLSWETPTGSTSSIDETVSHLSITATTYNTDGTLATMTYTGGYKTLYTYSSDNLSTVQYTDTDGATVLLTETMGYTSGNLTTVTRS